jgi:hypothetical protein
MRTLRAGLLPLVLILACSCGLPGAYYLEPPDTAGLTPATGSGQSFRVRTTDRSGDIAATFMGYEYYYKCYGNDTDAAFITDQGYGSEYYDYAALLSRGFHRFCRGPSNVAGIVQDSSPTSSSPPILNMRQVDLFDLPIDDSVTAGTVIRVWINDINEPAGLSVTPPAPASYLSYDPPSTLPLPTVAMEVRRFVAGTAQCKTFDSNATVSDNWLAGGADTDLSDAVYQQVIGSAFKELYIMVYAVTYGRSDDATTVRSYPVYLGYVTTAIF